MWTDRPRSNAQDEAMREFRIEGVKTTASLILELLHTPEMANGVYDTGFVERWLDGRQEGSETMTSKTSARYSFGGDDHVFVELDGEMSLTANFKAMAITQSLSERQLDGIIDICPANASYQIRFDPLTLAPTDLVALLKQDRVRCRRRDRYPARHVHRRGPGSV